MIPNLQIHILQQIWKGGTWEIAVSNPSQMCWEKVGLQRSASCIVCMETQSRHFEDLRFSEDSISEALFQKTFVPNIF